MVSLGKQSRVMCPLPAEAALQTPGFLGRLGWMPAPLAFANHPCVRYNLTVSGVWNGLSQLMRANHKSPPNLLFRDVTLAA